MEKVPPALMWRGGGWGSVCHWCAGVSLIQRTMILIQIIPHPEDDPVVVLVVWWVKRLARHKRRQRSDTTGKAETSADPQSQGRWSPWVTGCYTSHRNSNSAYTAHNRACSSVQNQECWCFYLIAISPIWPQAHPKKTHRLTMCWLWKTSTCFVLGFFPPHLTNSVTAHAYTRDGRECEKKSLFSAMEKCHPVIYANEKQSWVSDSSIRAIASVTAWWGKQISLHNWNSSSNKWPETAEKVICIHLFSVWRGKKREKIHRIEQNYPFFLPVLSSLKCKCFE